MVNFRKYTLSTGREIIGGKSAENNDELVRSASRNDLMLHTNEPGSPFVNVGEKPDKKEIFESAIFCARYSQDWRDNKKDVVVNSFLRSDMKKRFGAKTGSWNVAKCDKIKVKKVDVLKFEEKEK